jgi:glycosyltransferase involved in cell wall biosynthesis
VPAIFFSRQWSEAYKYSRPLAQWLAAHVREFDVAHIHAVFSHASLAAAKACRKAGVPYIVRPLGTLDPWSLRQKSWRKKLFWRLCVKQMLEGAARIHYTTSAERKLAESSLRLARGVVIPLGIEGDLFKQHAERHNGSSALSSVTSPYVLVLSRLHHKKGLELLLPAFLSLVKYPEFAAWKLVLAGDGEAKYVDSLKSLVRGYGGKENVVFAGWVDGNRRSSMLREASLLALTSYQENFGLCAVEALACGVPVIVSPQVNLSQEIKAADAGWVAPLEPAALESALADALHNPDERARRGAAGRELTLSRFTWKSVANELTNLYNTVIR